MLRFPLIAAVLSVLSTAALADSDKTLHVHNNTSYDFTGGFVHNKDNVTVKSYPSTIPAGESRSVSIHRGKDNFKLNMQWTLSTVNQNVAVKYKQTNGVKECHTDVPDGIHSDHYDCNSDDPKYYFCETTDTANCDK